jgi:2-polyprenyl-3-methyl-5-hydroxy-6-metoxy-1,4-benzoquinol methylase
MNTQVTPVLKHQKEMYTCTCRHCGSLLEHVFCDLVNSPPSNSMLRAEQLNKPEAYYPLKIFVCHNCFLVQVEEESERASEIFNNEYTYFSSFSATMLEHSRKYVDMMIERFEFDGKSFIVEVASNDGYLLQYFVKKGIPVLGIDPTINTSLAAKEKGVETIIDFFGADLAWRELTNKNRNCDLILGNNVLAHVPDINDFVKGFKEAINDTGIVTVEFPHIERLIEGCLFDSIYHEHFSYLSFTVVNRIFESQGLQVFDVEEVETHGGSLRVFAKNPEDITKAVSSRVTQRLVHESQLGMEDISYYKNFQSRVDNIIFELWDFLIHSKKYGKKVAGYGAAAKANTLLNFSGVKGTDLIEYCVDASPHKVGKYLPGSHIPVVSEELLRLTKPDFIIVFPWNLKTEIKHQLEYIKEWGGKLVVFVPKMEILNP